MYHLRRLSFGDSQPSGYSDSADVLSQYLERTQCRRRCHAGAGMTVHQLINGWAGEPKIDVQIPSYAQVFHGIVTRFPDDFCAQVSRKSVFRYSVEKAALINEQAVERRRLDTRDVGNGASRDSVAPFRFQKTNRGR